MSTELLATDAGSPRPAIPVFDRPRRGTAASYEAELTEFRLEQALAREAALLRERDELVRKLFAWHDAAINQLAGLTARQRQVMKLVLAGYRNKNIAAVLGISQRTVENHRAAVMKRTGSKCLPALARFALAAAWNDASDPRRTAELPNTGEPPREPTRQQSARRRRGPASRLEPPCPSPANESVSLDSGVVAFEILRHETTGKIRQSQTGRYQSGVGANE